MMARPPLEPLLAASHKGLKEWAVVCRSLLDGRQVVLLRKGGIIEETRDFKVIEQRFALFPTYEHQRPEHVSGPYEFDDPAPTGDWFLPGWASVEQVWLSHDLDAILALRDLHVWSDEYVRMRMAYKPRKPMNVVVVRAHRFASPMTVREEPEWAGCKSWVPLDVEVPFEHAPAVPDDRFAALAATVAGCGERIA